ncbi:MAG: hypothetical protein QOF60_2575 [Actinomycetota bacterium]|jgi:hypothetical protein|nr:hypothetical protein [Actinomycetota bacterium]
MRRRIIAAVFGVLLLVGGAAAQASWLAPVGAGNGASAAASVNGGNAPTVNASGSSVTVSWSASTLSGGTAVAGYVVKRYSSTDVLQSIGAGCSSTIVGLTCTETGVANGTWKYAVTPVKGTWTGAESSKTSVVVGVVADTTAPTAAITFPVSGGSYTSAAYKAGCTTASTDDICGTAADATGVQTVRVSVRLGLGNYWGGSSFNQGSEFFVNATLASTGATSTGWTLPVSPSADNVYTVHVQAVDTVTPSPNAQTGTTYAATATFNIDNVVPTAPVFTFPVASAAYNAAGWTAGCATASTDDICGTASDPATSGGIQKTQVSIKNAGGLYWNGAIFSGSAQSFVDATGTTSWTLAFARPVDGTYTLQAKTIDLATNASALSAAQTFTIDTVVPTVTQTFPVASATYTPSQWTAGCSTGAADDVCGTAADTGTGSVQSVAVTVQQVTGGKYWDGNLFASATPVALTATGTTSWNRVFAGVNFPSTGSYTVAATATDAAGNASTAVATTFTFTAPALAVTSVTSANVGATAGKAEVNDTFSVTFNKALDPTTVPSAAQTMTICSKGDCTPSQGAHKSIIAISGLTATAGFQINEGYTDDDTTATLAGSLTLSADRRTVTFTVTSISTGSGNLKIGTQSNTFLFTAAPALHDVAGVSATAVFDAPTSVLF